MKTTYSLSFAFIPLPQPATQWQPPPGATITRIADHAEIAVGQLAEQFRNSPNLQGLVGILAGRIQGLEDAFYSIYAGRAFPVATGDALSRWGAAVGEPRPTSGLAAISDPTYFGLVKAKILENVSEGTPEAALGLLRDLGALGVFYGEAGNYAAEIAIGQLAEQFRNSPNLQGLVGILAGRIQGLEDAFYSIYAGRAFPVAAGDAHRLRRLSGVFSRGPAQG